MMTKDEIEAAVRKEYDLWVDLISRMGMFGVEKPISPSNLSFKDELAHLRTWQEITIVRLEAGWQNKEPVLPSWAEKYNNDSDEELDRINAWIFAQNKSRSYEDIYRGWNDGFQKVISLVGKIPESNFFRLSQFPWLDGYSLQDVVTWSLAHYEEHRESIEERLKIQ